MKKKKILIVDDARTTLLSLKMNLEFAGYDIYTAMDGEAGLNMAISLKPDLILLDIMMPKIDGFSVCRLLKFDEEYENIPVILLTVKNQIKDKKICRQVGADFYITKPFDIKALISKVGELTGKTQVAKPV